MNEKLTSTFSKGDLVTLNDRFHFNETNSLFIVLGVGSDWTIKVLSLKNNKTSHYLWDDLVHVDKIRR